MEEQTNDTAVMGSESFNQLMHNLTESTIYLMGFSFILGSLCTVILLLILDFIRRSSSDKD